MTHRINLSEDHNAKLKYISEEIKDQRNANEIAALCIDFVYENIHNGKVSLDDIGGTQSKLDRILKLLEASLEI